jgi:PAS domain S-box-containing protein
LIAVNNLHKPSVNTQNEAPLESEERLQLALEASGDGLWDWKIAAEEVYFSPHWYEMLGYAANELPNEFSTWEKLLHPEDRLWVMDILHSHLWDSSVPYTFEYRMQTKCGEWKWIANYGKVVMRDKNGQPLRMTGIHRDISDRKKLELALQASETRLNNILTTASASIVSFRLFANYNWEYEYQSIGGENLFGYSAEEIMSDKQLWMSGVFSKDRETVIYPLFAEIFAERTTIVEYRFHHKDGSLRWISGSYSSHRDEAADCWIVTGVSIDISDRKRAEEVLRRSETLFRTLSDSAPIGIFRSDTQGINIYTNPRFQAICGLSFESSLGDWLDAIYSSRRFSRILATIICINNSKSRIMH